MNYLKPIRYVRVTLDDGTRRTLCLTGDTDRWLSGYEVNREGERVCLTDADGTDIDQLHMIDQAAIVKRVALRMNLHYGTLETAK